MKRFVECLFRGHEEKRATLLEGETGALEVVSCTRCRRRLRERELSPGEICGLIGCNRTTFVDRILRVERDLETGELVELAIERVHTCGRCGEAFTEPVPPELVPADVFERVERDLEAESEKTTVESIELDLGGSSAS